MERLQGRVRLGLVLIALARFTTVTADPNYNFMAGGAGLALYFDGTDSNMASVVLDTSPTGGGAVPKSTQASVEFWLRLRDPYQDEHAVLTYSAYDSSAVPFVASPTEVAISVNTKRNQILTTTRANVDVCGSDTCAVFEAGQQIGNMQEWMHLALTWKSTETDNRDGTRTYTYRKRLYHNGLLVYNVTNKDTTQDKLIPNGQLALGQQPSYFLGGYNEMRSFTGIIDEFRFWAVERDGASIKDNYQRQLNPKRANGVPMAELLIYYHFDEPDEQDRSYVLDREEWRQLIDLVKNYGSGGPRLDLKLGRTTTSENVMLYETERDSTPPNKPRFVFSDCPLTSPGGHVHIPVRSALNPDRATYEFDDIIIPLEYDLRLENVQDVSVWIRAKFDITTQRTFTLPAHTIDYLPAPAAGERCARRTSDRGNFGPTDYRTSLELSTTCWSGRLYQMGPDGKARQSGTDFEITFTRPDQIFGGDINLPAIKVSNQSKYPTHSDGSRYTDGPTWCGKAWGECPYAVVYRPERSRWVDKKAIHDRFEWVAYAPPSADLADYPVHGRSWGSYSTMPVKVNIYTDMSTDGWSFYSGSVPSLLPKDVYIKEDKVTLVYHSTVNDFGRYHNCTLDKLPNRGKLYELVFERDKPEVYSSMEKDSGKLIEIPSAPYTITNPRCVLAYKPPADVAGDFIDDWKFKYEDTASEFKDRPPPKSGFQEIIVSLEKVNDAPNEVPAIAKAEACFTTIPSADYCVVDMNVDVVGATISIKLNASDVDQSPVQTREQLDIRPMGFFTIDKFPLLGTLYQQQNEHGDLGAEVPQAPVLVATGNAFAVLNGSSQRTTCDDACKVPYRCSASCADTAYHLSNLAGEPNERYSSETAAWFALEDQFPFNSARDYVEMSIDPGDGTMMFLEEVKVFERENPGTIVQIKVAKEYKGPNTKWRTVGSYEPDLNAPGVYPSGRTWTPPICPIPEQAAYVRMEMARFTGQSPFIDLQEQEKIGIQLQPPSFDGVQFRGKLDVPKGMVTYESYTDDFKPQLRDYGRVIYKPMRGIHASGVFDRFSYTASDCSSKAPDPMEVVLRLSAPQKPESYCRNDDGLDYVKWPGEYNNATCVAEWMDYVQQYGHVMPSHFVRNASNPLQAWEETYVQPGVTQIVEVPVAAALTELFQMYGVNRSSICQMIEDPEVVAPYVKVNLAGAKGKLPTTTFYPLNKRRDGSVYPYLSETVIPNGHVLDSELKESYGYRCNNETSFWDFDTKFGFGMTMDSKKQAYSAFFLDSWIETQPPNAPSFYTVRVRQKILHMCNMNATHVHYLNRSNDYGVYPSYGVVVPRELYNSTGNCSDCFCNATHAEPCDARPMYEDEDQFCTPCQLLSDERVAQILQDPYETMHFRSVCAIMFEKCESGHFFDKDKFRRTGSLSLACTPCAPGSFKDVSSRDETCEPCPAGTFYPIDGAAKCLHCREFPEPGFSSYEGAALCTRCPRVCERFSSSGECLLFETYTVQLNASNAAAGLYLTDCVCKPGYYHPLQKVGEVCQPCVEGGFCEGGTSLPVPCGEGVFANDTLKSMNSDWEWQCVVDDTGYWGADGQITFFNCEGNHCLGGVGVKCKEGFANRLCSVCDEGYFGVGVGGCYKCPGGRFSGESSLLMLFGIVAVFASWYWLGVVVSGGNDSIDILLLYMQGLALINRFSINWPVNSDGTISDMHKALHMFFNLVNFDVDFLKPQCIMEWNYQSSFYLQLMFPLLMAGVAFSHFGYSFLCTKMLFKNVSYRTRAAPWFRTFVQPLDLSKDEATLKHLMDSSVASFLQFAVMNFNVLCEKSFEVFMCADVGDGSQFMTAGPEITCWSAQHYAMVFCASMSLVFNIVGIPTLLYALVKWAQYNDILNQRRFINAFGWIYMRYENDYNAWEIVLLLRRLFICLCTVFLADTPYLQSSTAIIVMTLCMGAHFFTRPFRLVTLDLLESIALIQTILYLVCGVLFESQPRFNTQEYTGLVEQDLLSAVALFSTMAILGLGIVLIWHEINDVHDSNTAMTVIEERLVEALEGVGLAYQLLGQSDKGEANTGVLTPETFMLRIKALHPDISDEACMDLYYAIDDDNSGTVDISEFRNNLWSNRRKALKQLSRMELGMFGEFLRRMQERIDDARDFVKDTWRPIKKKIMKTETARKYLPKAVLKEVRIRMKERLIKQVKKLNIMLCGDVARVFSGHHLRFFIENTLSDKAIIRYHQVDQWMSAAVADDSEIGIYASNSLLAFFRPLLEALPFLVDWLATASDSDRFHFRKVFESLFKCFEMIGVQGHYSKYIRFDYRPSVAIWLKDCTEEQQVVFWEMMHALTASNTTSEDEADKVAILRPYSLDHDDERFAARSDAKESELKVHYDGKAGMSFQFEPLGKNISSIQLDSTSKSGGGMFQDVKIVGEPKVGKLLVAAGEMPSGVSRCKFQWFRVRTKPDGSTAMEKVQMPNAPHYSVSRADVGCKLRMVVRPYFADGKAGKVSTAITAQPVTAD